MRIKKLIGLMLAIQLIIVLPAYAVEQRGNVVRVGYFDYGGFLEQGTNGAYAGYGYDYLREISSYTGWSYDFIYGSWEQCLQRLADGEIDLLCTAQYSARRARYYDYAKYASGTEYATLLVRRNNQTIFYNDYASFDGLRIGFMQNSFQNDLFAQYAQQHGFTYQPLYYNTATALKNALDSGEIDAMLTGSLQKILGEKAVAKFAPEPFYFITTKGNRALLDPLNNALEAIQTGDVDFNLKLYEKYYGEASASQLAFTREEAEYIARHPVLRVVYDASWAPLSYQNSATGEFEGVCADMMRLLSVRSGLQFEYIPAYKESEAIKMLQSGEADLVCGLDSSYLEGIEQADVRLSKSFIDVPVTFSKPAHMPFEHIYTVAVPQNCQSILRYMEAAYPDIKTAVYADTEACMLAVKRGQADAAAENTYVLDQYSKDQQFTELEPVLSAEELLPLSIAIRKDEDLALRTLLNKLITQLDDKSVNEILIRNTTEAPHLHIGGWIRRNLFILLFLVFVCVFAFVLHYQKKVTAYAFIDTLTGRENETRFLLYAKKLRRENAFQEYVIVSLDINKFKFINYIHGFELGNRLLCAISDIIAAQLESGERFCRQSNDLFLLLLRQPSDQMLDGRLKRMILRLSAVPADLGECFQCTMSCGVYRLSNQDDDLHQAIGWANLAREKAKERQRSHVVFYDDSMRRTALREQEITSHMEAALENGEFIVYYQPKVQLTHEEIVGAEALVRWQGQNGKIIGPDEFIPLFERNGFITRLDLAVFERVCRQLRDWLDTGGPSCPISVNLSRVHLSQPDFYLEYFKVMRKYNIDAGLIELEITESTLFEDRVQITNLLDKLKTAGVRVSIDDFGSGYSSLNFIKDLSFDYLKLDKEFFNMASDSERGQEVIRSVIEMAARLHMTVIAEGVETREQVEFLKANHCNMVQGYYYSKPLPADAFAERVKQFHESASMRG